MKHLSPELRYALQLAFRWHVALCLFIYGIGKAVQFPSPSGVNEPVNTLSGMELMWVFYGFSKPYAIMIGIVEIGGALLLVFRRTALLGCVLITAVLANVIAQDLAYGVHAGALRMAVINQVLVLLILVLHKERVAAIWALFTARYAPVPMDRNRWAALAVAAFLATATFTWWYIH